MKNVNNYFQGFNGTEAKLDYLKYGLLNERSFNLDYAKPNVYNEEKIIKTTDCFTKKES